MVLVALVGIDGIGHACIVHTIIAMDVFQESYAHYICDPDLVSSPDS